MHRLKISNGRIFLDDFELRDVAYYDLKQSAERVGVAELNIKLYVGSDLNVSLDQLADDARSDFRQSI